MNRLLICLFALLLSISLSFGEEVALNSHTTEFNLGPRISYIKAKRGDLSPEAIRSMQLQPHHKKLFFSGWHHIDSCYWLSFSYTVTAPSDTPLFIELDNALIAEIRYYVMSGNVIIDSNTAGDAYPFSARKMENRNFIYHLPMVPGTFYTVLFQVYNEGRSFHVPLTIRNARLMYTGNYNKQLIYGVFFGIMLIIILYNLTLYFLIREKIYFWLSLFIASFSLMQLVFSGYAFQYLCPGSPFLADKLGPLSTAASSFLALQFTRHFFNHNLGTPFLHKLTQVWQGLLGIAAVCAMFNGWFSFYAIWSLYYLFTFTYVIILLISIKNALRSNGGYARFFLGGIIIFVTTAMFINLYSNGDLTEENIFTNNTILVGMLLIFSSISVSAFDRLLLIKKQKEEAQAGAISSLEELNKLRQQNNLVLEQKVHEKTKELIAKQAQLNSALIAGEEQERKRFSQELHDGLGSMLSTIKLNLAALNNQPGDRRLDPMILMIDKACDEVRAISHNLTPPMFEKFGLVRSLHDIINRINETSHLTCHFEADQTDDIFNHSNALSIYRIVTELINNVIKHAGAGRLYVQLFNHDNELNIVVEDDGKGIDETDPHAGIGFTNIRSRLASLGGTINIDSKAGQGTTVIIQIPLVNIHQ